MSVFHEAKETINQQIENAKEAYAKVESSISENIRWLTTLTMAGIAALAIYRKDIAGGEGLGLPMTVTVAVLLIALLSFILCVIILRHERSGFDRKVLEARTTFEAKAAELEKNEDKSLNQKADDLHKAVGEQVAGLPARPSKSSIMELNGLSWLLLGAIFAVLIVFFEETLKALFGPAGAA